MKSRKLIDTNPYLKDPQDRNARIKRSIVTSSGFEGIKTSNNMKTPKIIQRRPKKLQTKFQKTD